MQPFQSPREAKDLSLEELRLPPLLRQAYLWLVMSFASGLGVVATLILVLGIGVVALPLVVVFPVMGTATAGGAVLAGGRYLMPDGGSHWLLGGVAMLIGFVELVFWLWFWALCLAVILPVLLI